jgi:hypothetical protein
MRKKDTYLVELGNRIKVLRQNKGLKVRELGLLCNIDYIVIYLGLKMVKKAVEYLL